MNTKQMTDTDAILAMKAENDRLRKDSEMLDWYLNDKSGLDLCVDEAGRWAFQTNDDSHTIVTGFHDTPRAAIKEAMERTK
jgi:hypothetical protein